MKYLILLIAAASLACCNSKTSQPKTDSQTTETSAEQRYSCPMHPEETGNKGDACGKCGMELSEVVE